MNYLALADEVIAELEASGMQSDPAPSPATPNPGMYGLGRCFDCGARLPAGIEIALCRNCRKARDPDAADTPDPLPPYPLRVVVKDEVIAISRPGVVADLAVLRRVVESYSWCWHDNAQVPSATELGERIDELLERLTLNGCAVRVQALS